MSKLAARFAFAIQRTGSLVDLVGSNPSASFYASIQPRKQTQDTQASPLGFHSTSDYTLYASADGVAGTLAAGDQIQANGQFYRIIHTQVFTLAGQALYRWAILRKE